MTLTGVGGGARQRLHHQTDLHPTSPPFCLPTKNKVAAPAVTLFGSSWERLVTHYSRTNHPTSSCQ